jgi:hypothetical protein
MILHQHNLIDSINVTYLTNKLTTQPFCSKSSMGRHWPVNIISEFRVKHSSRDAEAIDILTPGPFEY